MNERFMILLPASLLPALMFSGLVLASEPNVEPGEWEYTNRITYEGDSPIPDQSQTHTECLTVEDIHQGDAFIDDTEECQVSDMNIDRDGMRYSMVCEDGEGMSMRMDASVDFMGTRMSGRMNADLDTPMGPMSMKVEIDGERIGDC